MTQTIHISNGDTLNFPDEMKDEDIKAAINKEYGNQGSQQADQLNLFALKPSNRTSLGERIFNEAKPNYPVRDIGAGFLNIGNELLNAGPNVVNMFNKFSPQDQQPAGVFAPRDSNANALLGITNPNLSDQSMQDFVKESPLYQMGGEAAGSILKGAYPYVDPIVSKGYEAAKPYISQAGEDINKGFNYLASKLPDMPKSNNLPQLPLLQPKLLTDNLLNKLGGNQYRVNAEENINNISSSFKLARDVKEQEALSHLKPVFNATDHESMFDQPIESQAEGNIPEITKIFNKDNRKLLPEDYKKVGDEIYNYRSRGNVEKFIENIDEHFNPSKDLNTFDHEKIEDMLSVPESKESNYLSLVGGNAKTTGNTYQSLSPSARLLSDKFSKDSTFQNGHWLQSELGRDIGKLKTLEERQGDLSAIDKERLYRTKEAYKAITDDMESFTKNHLNPVVKYGYNTFKKSWKENVAPFKNAGQAAQKSLISHMSREGNTAGWTSDEIKNAFAFPGLSKEMDKIMQIMEPYEVKNKLVLNALGSNQEPRAVTNALTNLKQYGGYSKYMPSDIDAAINQINRHENIKDYIKKTGKYGLGLAGLGVGAGLGIEGFNAFR